jgi:hypothetical protein
VDWQGLSIWLAILVILEAIVYVQLSFDKHPSSSGLAPHRVRELRKERHVVTASESKGAFKAICRVAASPVSDLGSLPCTSFLTTSAVIPKKKIWWKSRLNFPHTFDKSSRRHDCCPISAILIIFLERGLDLRGP